MRIEQWSEAEAARLEREGWDLVQTFMGPPGIGKTTSAKAVASYYTDDHEPVLLVGDTRHADPAEHLYVRFARPA